MTLFILIAALFSLCSCGDSRDRVMQDQIDYMNSMGETLEAVASGEMSSADAAEEFSKLKEDGDRFLERKEVLMKDMSAEEGEALIKKYSKDAGEAANRFMLAIEQVRKAGRMTPGLINAIANSK